MKKINNLTKLGTSFWIFNIGEFISNAGDMLAYFAVSLWVLQKTGSAIDFSKILIPALLIQTFLPPFFSPIMDRFNRKKLIIIVEIFKLLISFTDLYLIVNNMFNIELLIFFAVIGAVFSSLTTAANQQISQFLVKKENLGLATRTTSTIGTLKVLFNILFASSIVSFFGIKVSLIINLATYLVAIVGIYFCHFNLNHHLSEEKFNLQLWIKDLLSINTFIFKSKEIVFLLVITILVQFLTAHFVGTLPFYIISELKMNTSVVGISEFAIVIGGLISSVFVFPLFEKMKIQKLLSLCFLLFAISFSIMKLNIYSLYFSLFVISVFGSIVGITYATILAQSIPIKIQSKFFNFFNLYATGLNPLFLLLSSVYCQKYSASFFFSFLGIISLLAAVCLGLISFLVKSTEVIECNNINFEHKLKFVLDKIENKS